MHLINFNSVLNIKFIVHDMINFIVTICLVCVKLSTTYKYKYYVYIEEYQMPVKLIKKFYDNMLYKFAYEY